MRSSELLAMPLADALERLCGDGNARRVRVVPVSPPEGAATAVWRVARVDAAGAEIVVVTAVGEIEGTSGCNERFVQN